MKTRKNHKGHELRQAAHRGNLESVEKLLAAGADVNSGDRYGYTPLHNACSRPDFCNPELIKTLLEAGADANVHNNWSETPLHNATYNSHVEAVQVLLKEGASPNVSTKNGITPLHYIDLRCASPYYDFEDGSFPRNEKRDGIAVAGLILDARADPNAQDDKGKTPVHALAEVMVSDGMNKKIYISGGIKCLKKLLKAGADKTIRDREGKSAWDYVRGKDVSHRLRHLLSPEESAAASPSPAP